MKKIMILINIQLKIKHILIHQLVFRTINLRAIQNLSASYFKMLMHTISQNNYSYNLNLPQFRSFAFHAISANIKLFVYLNFLKIFVQFKVMHQSGYEYRDGSSVAPKFSHQIEMLSLAILYISFFSCLIRSDFNFPIIFFVYFIWQQRKDSLALKLILASVITVMIFDLLFLFTEMRVWIQDDTNNPIWGTLRPMHNFGIFCFVIIMILKIVLLVFIGRAISNMNQAVQPV